MSSDICASETACTSVVARLAASAAVALMCAAGRCRSGAAISLRLAAASSPSRSARLGPAIRSRSANLGSVATRRKSTSRAVCLVWTGLAPAIGAPSCHDRHDQARARHPNTTALPKPVGPAVFGASPTGLTPNPLGSRSAPIVVVGGAHRSQGEPTAVMLDGSEQAHPHKIPSPVRRDRRAVVSATPALSRGRAEEDRCRSCRAGPAKTLDHQGEARDASGRLRLPLNQAACSLRCLTGACCLRGEKRACRLPTGSGQARSGVWCRVARCSSVMRVVRCVARCG